MTSGCLKSHCRLIPAQLYLSFIHFSKQVTTNIRYPLLNIDLTLFTWIDHLLTKDLNLLYHKLPRCGHDICGRSYRLTRSRWTDKLNSLTLFLWQSTKETRGQSFQHCCISPWLRVTKSGTFPESVADSSAKCASSPCLLLTQPQVRRKGLQSSTCLKPQCLQSSRQFPYRAAVRLQSIIDLFKCNLLQQGNCGLL